MMNDNFKQLIFLIILGGVIFSSVFFLLKYFYPSEDNVKKIQSSDQVVLTDDELLNGSSTVSNNLREKTNLVLADVENAVFIIDGNEVAFSEGKSHLGTEKNGNFEIKIVAFGDVNSDGNGDALVVTSTDESEGNPILRNDLFVLLNKEGLVKSIQVIPPIDSNLFIKNYKKIDILNDKIVVHASVSQDLNDNNFNNWKDKVLEFSFLQGNLVKYENKVLWKKYTNNEFGFEISYPEKAENEVRSLSDGNKNISNSLFFSVSLPFVTQYNTWTDKEISILIRKTTCPFRNESIVMKRNGIDFHLYEPDSNTTSNTENVLKTVEYMTYKDGYCYTLISKLRGPGPLSPDFPKENEVRSPLNLENFFAVEFVILNQVLDTFRFI